MKQLYFHNFSGRTYPDFSRTTFDSMHVIDGVVLKTGFELPVPNKGIGVDLIDLQGSIVFPAFCDSHIHFLQTGVCMLGADLNDAESISGVTGIMKRGSNHSGWLLGYGLDDSILKDGLPNQNDLNNISNKYKVWITRKDLHSAVVNSLAEKWLRQKLPSIEIANGYLSGKSFNEAAYILLNSYDQSTILAALELAEKTCFSYGIASIHAMEGSAKSLADIKTTADFLDKSPLDATIYHQSPNPDFCVSRGWKQLGGCILADGSLGTRSAALWEDYSDMPGQTGNVYLSPEDIEEMLKACAPKGIQLALHAIGDRAIDTVMFCYNWSFEKFGSDSPANRIEHFVLPSAKAIRYARQTRTHICVQPAFDFFWGGKNGLYEKRLGPDRLDSANPLRTLLDLGIRLAGGSDSPVTPPNPMLGIQAAVNHNNPDERVDLNTAFSMFITDGHHFSGKANQRGKLSSGFFADFITFKDDPFLTPSIRLKNHLPERLFIKGNLIKKA